MRWSVGGGPDALCVQTTAGAVTAATATRWRLECVGVDGRARVSVDLELGNDDCASSPCRVQERIRVRAADERVNPEAPADAPDQLLFPRHVCARPTVEDDGRAVRLSWQSLDVEVRAHVHQWLIVGDRPPVRAPDDGQPLTIACNASSLVVQVFDAAYESCPSWRWRFERRSPLPSDPRNQTQATADVEAWRLATLGESLPRAQQWVLAVLGVWAWTIAFVPHVAAWQPACMTTFGLVTVVLWTHLLPLTLAAAATCIASNQLVSLALEAARGRVRFPTKTRMSEIRALLSWNAWTVLAAIVVHAVL